MAVKDGNDRHVEDIKRLFGELDDAYARAADAASPAVATDTAAHGRFVDESGKALAIIRRIREMEGFGQAQSSVRPPEAGPAKGKA
jgi:hypothetical protein